MDISTTSSDILETNINTSMIELDSSVGININNNNVTVTAATMHKFISKSPPSSMKPKGDVESIIKEIEPLTRLFNLPVEEKYKTESFKQLMNLLRQMSTELVNNPLDYDITSIVDNDKCIQFYSSYLKLMVNNHVMLVKEISRRHFINFVKFNMSLWNFSDKYDSICVRMVKYETHISLIRLLGKLTSIVDEKTLLNSAQLAILILSIMGILHNINTKLQYTRGEFRNEKLVDFLMPWASLRSTEDQTQNLLSIRTAALLLLAFLVNEDENDKLNATDEHIVYFINILRHTIESNNLYSISDGYHCLEILRGLRHIAAPDSNKRRLVINGILSLISQLLISPEHLTNGDLNENGEPNNESFLKPYSSEVAGALELLWSLSFSRECLLALDTDKCQLRSAIDWIAKDSYNDHNKNMYTSTIHVSKDDKAAILLAARGIIWNINNTLKNNVNHLSNSHNGHVSCSSTSSQDSVSTFNSLIRKESSISPNVNGHIMISYQHSTQATMTKIKDKLVENGYNVWMDVDHMTGSFVDAMAEGIQHASILVLGICQAFKNSPHCRQEVKYAYTLGIPLVPIMLEQGFVADGWLGLMCATLIYTEFFDDNTFNNDIYHLQKQIGNRGRATLPSRQNSSNVTNLIRATTTVMNKQCSTVSTVDSLDFGRKHSQPECDLSGCDSSLPNHYVNGNDSSDNLQSSIRSDHSLAISRTSIVKPVNIDSNNMHTHKLLSLNSDHSSNELTKTHIYYNWSSSQCRAWLKERQVILPDSLMEHLTGSLLLELVDMRMNCPDSFFTSLRLHSDPIDLIGQLSLSRSLKEIDKLPL